MPDQEGWTPAAPPEPSGDHEILTATPATRAGRERLIWTALVAGMGLLTFGLLVVSSMLPTRPDLQRVTVDDILGNAVAPAARFGSNEIRVVGWFVTLKDGCQGDSGGADASVAWLQRDCPLRVLLQDQPSAGITQAQLEARGIRLSAPTGEPFPPPTAIGAGTAGLEELVFVGHFDDPATAKCVPERAERCRNTFVASDYDPLIH
ncbi:MAG TPA: hypothetical protein VFX74_03785 [Candidatus Limnocylindria bacterium]|jgi:hypothetical protein|nr:hypothetical protein [Candidatus Limnocylindria bacterium]